MKELNDRHRKFVEGIVAGETGTAAYFAAFPRCKSEKTARSESSKLLKNPNIRAAIKSLRAEVASKVVTNLVADKQEALEFLTNVMRTPVGDVDEKDQLAQEVWREQRTRGRGEDAEPYEVTKIKVPCKLKAVERMAKMLGWDEPEKVSHEAGDSLLKLIGKIRSRS